MSSPCLVVVGVQNPHNWVNVAEPDATAHPVSDPAPRYISFVNDNNTNTDTAVVQTPSHQALD